MSKRAGIKLQLLGVHHLGLPRCGNYDVDPEARLASGGIGARLVEEKVVERMKAAVKKLSSMGNGTRNVQM